MAYFQPTFTNGTQTWASFSGSPYVTGFNITVTGTTTFTLSQGSARSFTKSEAVSYIVPEVEAPATLNLDASTVGALGCYPIAGSLAAPTYDTAFGVYVLGTTSGLVTPGNQVLYPTAVIATGNNFLLPGYDIWRRVGTVIIEAGTNTVLPMTQTGNNNERTYLFENAYTLLSAGTSTSLVQLNLSSSTHSYGVCNPSLVSNVILNCSFTPASATDQLILNTNSTAPSTAGVAIQSPTTAAMNVEVIMPVGLVSGNSSVYYSVSSGSDAATILLAGFTESLGISAI